MEGKEKGLEWKGDKGGLREMCRERVPKGLVKEVNRRATVEKLLGEGRGVVVLLLTDKMETPEIWRGERRGENGSVATRESTLTLKVIATGVVLCANPPPLPSDPSSHGLQIPFLC